MEACARHLGNTQSRWSMSWPWAQWHITPYALLIPPSFNLPNDQAVVPYPCLSFLKVRS